MQCSNETTFLSGKTAHKNCHKTFPFFRYVAAATIYTSSLFTFDRLIHVNYLTFFVVVVVPATTDVLQFIYLIFCDFFFEVRGVFMFLFIYSLSTMMMGILFVPCSRIDWARCCFKSSNWPRWRANWLTDGRLGAERHRTRAFYRRTIFVHKLHLLPLITHFLSQNFFAFFCVIFSLCFPFKISLFFVSRDS